MFVTLSFLEERLRLVIGELPLLPLTFSPGVAPIDIFFIPVLLLLILV